MEQIKTLLKETCQDIETISCLKELGILKAKVMGKTGPVATLMKQLATMTEDERKENGPHYHGLRTQLAQAFTDQESRIKEIALAAQLEKERVDLSLSPEIHDPGTLHPLTRAMDEAVAILRDMGFSVAEGPDIEDDDHNFTALNIPAHHPARQEQDTFYLPKNREGQTLLLRTHTSPVQIRAMKQSQPPIRLIAPGRVYRSDYDQTHTPTFHQIEGLYIDKDITMGHLKWCLEVFCRRFFKVDHLPVRFRPAYFPFTEPSAEIDIGCHKVNGRIVLGGQEDWLEILGSGMVHPNVIKRMGLDPQEWQGFAFGMGVERLAMLKYGINDLRAFYEGDVRWSQHFGLSLFDHLKEGAQ